MQAEVGGIGQRGEDCQVLVNLNPLPNTYREAQLNMKSKKYIPDRLSACRGTEHVLGTIMSR